MINGEIIRLFIRSHRTTTLVVALGSGIIAFALTIWFPATDLQDAEQISSNWPRMMRNLFGDPIYGFTSIYGWLNLQIFHITFWIIFGIFASLLASTIVAKEVEEKTIDILLSSTVTRYEIVINRLVGLCLLISVSILPLLLGCIFGILILGQPLELNLILFVCVLGVTLFLVCAATNLLISVFIPSQTFSLVITWCILGFMFFFEELLVKLAPAMEKFAFLSPFHFYSTGEVLIHNSIDWLDPFILFSVFLTLSFFSVFLFSRKDILL